MLATISIKKFDNLKYTILQIAYDQETHGFKALCATDTGKLVELGSEDLSNCKLSSSKVILSPEK